MTPPTKVYSLSESDFSFVVGNTLHSIKYEAVVDEKVTTDCIYGVEHFYSLSRREQEQLGKLAVYVAVSFHRRQEVAPSWSMDSRIFLEPPYVHRYCSPEDIISAYQPSYDHNVFVPLTSFDVL